MISRHYLPLTLVSSKTPLEKAKPLVATLNDGVNAAADVAPYLPQMLGANGQTRTYVIIAQNNSELRATEVSPAPPAHSALPMENWNLENFRPSLPLAALKAERFP